MMIRKLTLLLLCTFMLSVSIQANPGTELAKKRTNSGSNSDKSNGWDLNFTGGSFWTYSDSWGNTMVR